MSPSRVTSFRSWSTISSSFPDKVGVFLQIFEIRPVNPQHTGKVRLAKWFTTMPPKAKAKIVKDVTQLVLARRTRMCNFLEYKGVWHCSRIRVFFSILMRPNRHQGRVPSICIAVLCLRNRVIRQWIGYVGDHTSIRGGSWQILWECEFSLKPIYFLSLFPTGVWTGPVRCPLVE